MRVDKTHAVMGKITSVYGVKGWVKVISYAQPKENIARYSDWILDFDGRQQSVVIAECKPYKNGMLARVEGCSDRDQAAKYCNALVKVPVDTLPKLDEGEYYWHQLEGLSVTTSKGVLLGKVSYLIETGSNDVLVVRGCEGSVDGKERLIPYLPGQVVKGVDLHTGEIEVDWDPDF